MSSPTRRRFLQGASLLCGAAACSPLASAQTPKPRIKIGQIGTAHAHASGKLAAIRASPDFEFVGICENDPKLREAAEKQKAYAGVKWMTEAELFATPELRAIAVETSVKDLLATGQRCIDAGFHIHLDKPAGESLPAFRKLLADATARKLTVQMGYMFRHNPAFFFLKDQVMDQHVGLTYAIDASMGKLASKAERQSLLAYKGGAMFELGCHLIDQIVLLLGRPDKVTPFNRAAPRSETGALESCMAVLEYNPSSRPWTVDAAVTATVRSSLIEVGGNARRSFTVFGTRETVIIQPLEPPLMRFVHLKDDGSEESFNAPQFEKIGRYDGCFIELAAVIRGERAFPYSNEHDLAVQETILLASGLPIT